MIPVLCLAATAAAHFLAAPAAAGQPASDKSHYWLGDPTPREQRRDLSADRPDATESPYTVDAGALQLEMSFVEYASRGADSAGAVAPANVKVGLTNDSDLQFVLLPYQHEEAGGDGFGDIGLRLKINLWGNDGGPLAVGFLPFITFPAGQNEVSAGAIEGGVIVPAALDLGAGWGLGGQVQFDFVRGEGEGYETVLGHTLAVSREVWGPLDAYVEWIGEITLDADDDYTPAIGFGASWSLTADAQLDAGAIVGLDRPETEDIRLFAGITWRY